MPELFENNKKIKIIEYGEHADDGMSWNSFKSFLFTFLTAKML